MNKFETSKWLQESGPSEGTLEKFLNLADRAGLQHYTEQHQKVLREIAGLSIDLGVRKLCNEAIASSNDDLKKWGVYGEVKNTPLHLV